MRSADNRHKVQNGGDSNATPASASESSRQKLLLSSQEHSCVTGKTHCKAMLPPFGIAESNKPTQAEGPQLQAIQPVILGKSYSASNAPRYAQVMNEATVNATMKNEEAQHRSLVHIWGTKLNVDIDGIKDKWATYVGGDFDVGPAKMSVKQIKELKGDPRYNSQLKNIDELTEAGARKLIDAYYRREMDRFDHGDYLSKNAIKFNEDRPRDIKRPIVRGNFNFAQELWDKAKTAGDTDTMRKVLIESYNAGKHTVQIKEVERIRTGDPNWSHVDVRKWEKKPK